VTITPTADLIANDWTTLSAAVPFLAAIVLLLISPLLTAKVKTAVLDQIDKSAYEHDVTEDMIPPSRGRDSLDAYVEYAIEAVQIIPLALLPVAGAVFFIAADVRSEIALGYLALGYLVFAIVAAVAVESWVLSQPAGKYVSCRPIKNYSVVAFTGIVSNLLGLAMILLYLIL
jgi:hypothetical protein